MTTNEPNTLLNSIEIPADAEDIFLEGWERSGPARSSRPSPGSSPSRCTAASTPTPSSGT